MQELKVSKQPEIAETVMTGIQRDLSKDNRIDVTNMMEEFQRFPSLLFAYCEAKAVAEQIYDRLKQQLEELEAETYIRIKSGPDKVTEAGVAALVTVDPVVKVSRAKLIDARRDLEMTKNYVESMRAKKDCMIQIGADLRKE